eukprot:TRINITY_DN8509_c0_g1_i1.p1 TRINITY_DN8509_c0_g1~~TRINITY_DN8509_c0_g1_i1.p1  ORF type:complete len:653 (-),score=170.60 TRINITY_DN8509_c0_g1_i1:44-1981(-)
MGADQPQTENNKPEDQSLVAYLRANKDELLPVAAAVVGSMIAQLGVLAYRAIKSRTKLILELDLDTIQILLSPPKENISSVFSGLGKPRMTLRSLLECLYTAKSDKKVVGLVIINSELVLPAGVYEEIRSAVLDFKKDSGKFVYFYADTLGEASPANSIYWLATAADKIFMCEAGFLNACSFNAEIPFVKNLLEKIGVDAQIKQRKAYKNYANIFLEDKLTKEHKEATTRLLESIRDTFVEDIASSRSISKEQANNLFETAPLSSKEALAGKFIDEIIYRDQLYKRLKENDSRKFCYTSRYFQLQPHKFKNSVFNGNGSFFAKKFAVIHLEGGIVRGDGGDGSIGAESTCRAIRQATEDKSVKAIILRINSGGGSANASDLIDREVLRAKESGKVVVASMLGVAASGGYYIAMNADRILVQRITFTGSIGVINGKFVYQKLLTKIGITFDDAKTGENSTIYSSNHHFSPEDEKRVDKATDEVYDMFTSKVAKARNLSQEDIEKVAQGRVWTGVDALQHKLVDEIGGLYESVQAAKKLTKLPDSAGIKLVRFPKPVPLIATLMGKNQPMSSEDVQVEPTSIQASTGDPKIIESALVQLASQVSDVRLKAVLHCIRLSFPGRSESTRIAIADSLMFTMINGGDSTRF